MLESGGSTDRHGDFSYYLPKIFTFFRTTFHSKQKLPGENFGVENYRPPQKWQKKTP
jgi:hypothetical protein